MRTVRPCEAGCGLKSMMTITVKFFASFQEILGTNSVLLSPEEDIACVADLIEYLEQQYPVFEGRLEKRSLVAVNEQYSQRHRHLSDGDVIAFFPPVSGG
ncbi:molybdopterin converting factor subunit 1 [candidate division KSB3 bacterium]|uniref:Molybdopterin synthase sulfur carrier subunit n=1 Tax=candidate division KSB3 bacterium TaxID=2044937 RepID=A0A2G6E9Q2_9BACT|nr:MAG: molybdopterin converting factor subunit 1 [candidate division KSB3 bacterium]PIE30856.1 MAG: molybdopterin converting factor subunit 1 [candidate division KSB3 bacterium]